MREYFLKCFILHFLSATSKSCSSLYIFDTWVIQTTQMPSFWKVAFPQTLHRRSLPFPFLLLSFFCLSGFTGSDGISLFL